MSKKISMIKLITADFYRRNAETIINSQKSIAVLTIFGYIFFFNSESNIVIIINKLNILQFTKKNNKKD